MVELFFEIPLKRMGWIFIHFLWISTLYLGGIILTLKIFKDYSPEISYKMGLGALFSLPFIPGLLMIEHSGFLPPIGLANWSSSTGEQTTSEPILKGLPQFTGIELGGIEPVLYQLFGIIWILTAAVMVGFYLYSLIKVQLICQQKYKYNDQQIYNCLQELARNLDIATKFRIRCSDEGAGPAVAGVFHPYILLPPSLSDDYNSNEQKALLLHELIHIKRNDYFVASLQQIIQSIFFFQPLVWWLSRKINLEREHICDQTVIDITNDKYSYGNLLVKLHLQTQASLANSLNITGNDTIERIRRLTKGINNSTSHGRRYIRNGVSILIVGITLFCTLWNSYHMHYSHQQSFEVKSEWVRSD